MQCPACGHDNKTGRRFCGGCGAALPSLCPACGFSNEPIDRFCGGCGQPLPGTSVASAAGEGERRPVSILFADLSGYTALTNRLDPEETQGVLAAFYQLADRIIREAGGLAHQHIGDCVMALFGAPTAHPDDPLRAVRTALAIRAELLGLASERGLDGLDLHCGVATGMVMAASVGSDVRRDYAVTGPVVNLAARLCDAAPRGTTLISAETRLGLDGRFACEEAGLLRLDGFEQPIPAWRVTDDAAPTPAQGGALPFVGRDAELALLTERLDAAVRTGTGAAILLRGEAGIGKSRLAEELRQAALLRGIRAATAAVLEFGAGRRMDATQQLARSLAGSDKSEDEIEGFPRRLLEQGHLRADEAAAVRDLLGLAALPEEEAPYAAMSQDERRRARAEAMGRLAGEACRSGPLLVLVEDIHWADAATLAILAGLAASLRQLPALLVMTCRIESDPIDEAWRRAIGGTPFATIDLARLAPDDALALAGSITGSDARARSLAERSDGNPLFLAQLLHHKAEDNTLPVSIASAVVARLDRLAAKSRRALQAASVLGVRFVDADLARLLPEESIGPADLALVDLVRPSGSGFEFAHALIREAVYGTLPKSRRRALHRAAAACFAPRDKLVAAQHLDLAEDSGAPRAYAEAAREDMASYHFERALALAERALRIATDPAERFALLEIQAEAHAELGDIHASLSAYGEAAEIAPDDASRCRAEIGLAQGMRLTDRLREAEEALARAEAVAERLPLPEELARIHHLRGNLFFPQGRLEECLQAHARSLDLARTARSVEAEVRALGGMGDANYLLGRFRTAHALFRDCVALARTHGLARIEFANAPMEAFTRFLTEGPGALSETFAVIDLARRARAQRPEMIGHHGAFLALIEQGRTAEATRHAELAEEIAQRLGARRFQAENAAFLARAARLSGRPDEALRLAREGWRIAEETGPTYFGPIVLAEIAAASDTEAERESAIERATALLAGRAVSHNYLFFYRAMIEADLASGLWKQAFGWADALDAFMAGAEPFGLGEAFVAWGRALARWGMGERGAEAEAELMRVENACRTLGLTLAADKASLTRAAATHQAG